MRKLIYNNYELNFPDINFFYEVDGEKIVYRLRIFNILPEALEGKEPEALNNLIFHIGMVLVSNLFYADDFDQIVIRPYKINREFADFFSTYFKHGLAELRFKNNIDVNKEVNIVSDSSRSMPKVSDVKLMEQALILNGEGKDSMISGEIAKKIGLPFAWLSVNPSKKIFQNISSFGNKKLAYVELKEISKGKLENKYSDHKPFNGIIGFIGLLVAYLTGTKYIVVGNEYSANFENVCHDGLDINHQYCKSFDFEILFNDYATKKYSF